jgi:hypothetical protein
VVPHSFSGLPCWGIMSRYDRPSHRVFMVFFLRSGWSVQFLEQDCRTPLPRKFNFRDPEKIRELARRGEAMATQDARALKGIEEGH